MTKGVTFSDGGCFLRVLSTRVDAVLTNRTKRGDRRLWGKAALLILWFAGSYQLMLLVPWFWVQFVLAVSYGLAAAAVGFNIFHDSNHGTFSIDTRVNLTLSVFTCTILGVGRHFWIHKHHVLHHRFTNIYGWDDDLETRGWLRLSPRQPWKPRHHRQHFFFILLYAGNTLEWLFIKDFSQYFSGRINHHRKLPSMTLAQRIEFWSCKALYGLFFVLLPLMLLPFVDAVVLLLTFHAVFGTTITLVFNLAHEVEEVQFLSTEGDSLIVAEEWGAHQMRTTSNFATGHMGWDWFTGGLNHQIEHHLFPRISHTLYPEISPIVRKTAAEFGLPYINFPTYMAALKSHRRLLRTLGAKTPKEALLRVTLQSGTRVIE